MTHPVSFECCKHSLAPWASPAVETKSSLSPAQVVVICEERQWYAMQMLRYAMIYEKMMNQPLRQFEEESACGERLSQKGHQGCSQKSKRKRVTKKQGKTEPGHSLFWGKVALRIGLEYNSTARK